MNSLEQKPFASVGCLVICQFVLWDRLYQVIRAVASEELASRLKEEILEGQLMTMLETIHKENSGRHLDANGPIGIPSTTTN